MKLIIITLFIFSGKLLFSQANVVWEKALDESGRELPQRIVKIKGGGFAVVSIRRELDEQQKSLYGFSITKTDNEGEVEWKRSFYRESAISVGAICQTSDGGFIISGVYFRGTFTDSSQDGLHKYWYVKVDKDGEFKWKKAGAQMKRGGIVKMFPTNDGGVIVFGNNYHEKGKFSKKTNTPMWVIKLNGSGTVCWQNAYSTGETGCFVAADMLETKEGNIILVANSLIRGDSHGKGMLYFSINQKGEKNWQRIIKDEAFRYSIGLISDGTTVSIVCCSNQQRSSTGKNVYIYKTDQNGEFISKVKLVLPSDKIFQVSNTDNSSFYLVGKVESDFISEDGIRKGSWVFHLDNTYRVIWKEFVPNVQTPNSVVMLKDEIIVVGNGLKKEENFDFGQNLMISKLKHLPNAEIESSEIKVFPNPTKRFVSIVGDNYLKVEIYNIDGKLLKQNNKNRIDLGDYEKGTYIMRIYTVEGVIEKKLIKH